MCFISCNESEHDKVVRLLKEENNDLKKKIEELSKKLLGGGVVEEVDKEAFRELKAQYDETQKICESMSKTFSERLEEAKKQDKELGIEKVDISKPHLVVLNEDPQLSHKLKYPLNDLPIYVGRKLGNPAPKITLSGIGIKQNHAIFTKGEKEGEIILKPNDKEAIKYIFINGKRIKSQDGQILKNKDRIIFGNNTIMLFLEKSDGKDLYEIDWEMAQTELQNELEEQNKLEEMENEKKRQQAYDILKQSLEQKYTKEKKEIEDKMNLQFKEYEDKINEMKNQNEEIGKLEKQNNELEMKLKFKLKRLQSQKTIKRGSFQSEVIREENLSSSQNEKLEIKLINIVKKIHKFKVFIDDLKRNVELDLFLSKNLIDHYNDPNTPMNIFIRVNNYEEGNVYYWTQNMFNERYDSLKELYNKFLDENYNISELPKEEDPLYDKPQQSLLGYAFFKLEPLAYLMNNCIGIPIISVNGENEGSIIVDVIPVDENGNTFEEIPEDPNDLIGENFKFIVEIKEVKDLPEYFCKGLQVEYTSFSDNKNYKTKKYNEEGKETSFIIGEKFEHEISYLTEEDVDFFLKDKICFKIYAYETVEIQGKKGIPNKDEIKNSHIKFDINMNIDNIEKNKNGDKKKKIGKTMTRFNTSGILRKTMTTKSSKNLKNIKDKDKDCLIF